tara:strand:+ start:2392 stop:2769 length:378 start_codon:yes stop_codon:yes gene_type:complete
MSQSFLTAFNNLVIKFNEDLIDTFPEENDFKVYKRAIILLNMANAKKICKLFKNYMILYRENIINEDETFFLSTNYKEIVEDAGTEGIESIIHKLKNYWSTLSSGNKTKVWGYLNSLIKLSDLIN